MLGQAAVVAWLAVVEDGGCAPQRVVGTGQQHLVARLQQGAQAQVDQLADAVANENALDLHALRTAMPLLRGDDFAGFFQALLVAIGLAVMQMTRNGLAQVGRRFEAVAPGVADIELDNGQAGRLQLARSSRECATDFIAHVRQVRTGFDRGQRERPSFFVVADAWRRGMTAC